MKRRSHRRDRAATPWRRARRSRRGALGVALPLALAVGACAARPAAGGEPADVAARHTSGGRFVATTGDDANPGTRDRPWRTIQRAMSSAPPGSTVHIRAGTYREVLAVTVSGTPGRPITFQPYGFAGSPACGGRSERECAGEQVVIDYAFLGTVKTPRPALRISGQHDVVIQGLTFRNYSVDGPMHVGILVDGGSRRVHFRWVRVERFRNVHAPGQDGTTMLAAVRVGWKGSSADDVTFSDCRFFESKTNMSEVLSYDLGAANGVVERCHFRDSDGIALHAYRGAHHFTFRDNLFEWCGVTRDGRYPDGEPSATIYNDGGHDGVIERNVVRDSAWGIQSLAERENRAQGLPAMPPAFNVVIRNNLVVRSRIGIVVGTWYSDNDGRSVRHHDVYNNTLYRCGVGFEVRPFSGPSTRVRNNIVAECGVAFRNDLGWDVGRSFDHNLYFGGGGGPDAHAVHGDPMFVDAAGGDFRLRARSPAIDAGDPETTRRCAGDRDLRGAPRFEGRRVDLGANEAGGAGR